MPTTWYVFIAIIIFLVIIILFLLWKCYRSTANHSVNSSTNSSINNQIRNSTDGSPNNRSVGQQQYHNPWPGNNSMPLVNHQSENYSVRRINYSVRGGNNEPLTDVKNMSVRMASVKSPKLVNDDQMQRVINSPVNDLNDIDLTPQIPKYFTPPAIHPHEIMNGGRISKGEKKCMEVLAEIFPNKPFLRVRPGFLRNPETQRCMELDCYNAEMGLAIEYNGVQHYKFPSFPGFTQEQFKKQLIRDNLKRELCDENGVYLIVVPYNVHINKIKEFILSNLEPWFDYKPHYRL